MKKTIILLFLFLVTFALNAQKLQGIVTYEQKLAPEKLLPEGALKNITPDEIDLVNEIVKELSDNTFTLTFDKDASAYEQEVKLEVERSPMLASVMKVVSEAVYGLYYKNIKKNYSLEEKHFLGKQFLVKETLEVFDWELSTESKKIGSYTCYKATANISNKLAEDKKLLEEEEENDTNTNFLDMFNNVPDELIVTAWYTPEIPISQGPSNYWGLPGLILELHEGDHTTLLCSKIVLNPKKKKMVKVPNKGKIVNQEEFKKIAIEKAKEIKRMSKVKRW